MADKVFPELGVVHFTRRLKCKNIIGKIKHDGEIYITHPWLCSQARAERFLIERTDWFLAHLEKHQSNHKPITEGREKFTHFHDLQIVKSDDTKLQITTKNNIITIKVPCNTSIENPEIQKKIVKTLEEILRKEAKEFIPPKVRELANRCGFTYSKISIRNAKTRWGSCNSQKDLMFSLYVMTLPYEHIEHILLHELCHTIYMNHSKKFYEILDTCCGGNIARLRKEHKKHEMTVSPKFDVNDAIPN